MRKNSIKNTRVNAEVQRELGNILRGGIKDPRVAPMTSVVAVEVAPDLKTCKAFISVLGDEKAQQDTLKGLLKHCVANMFYFSVANAWSLHTCLYLLIMTLGNLVGGVLPELAKKCWQK